MLTDLQEVKDLYSLVMFDVLSLKRDVPDSCRGVTNYHQDQQKFQKRTMFYGTISEKAILFIC